MQILLFHGIVDKQDIYEKYKWKHISSDNLKKIIKKYEVNKEEMIFSFDDAYKNCYESCVYLRKNNFNVSIAVPTSRVGTSHFWNDEIEVFFLKNPKKNICINNCFYELTTDKKKISSLEDFKKKFRSLKDNEQQLLMKQIKLEEKFWEKIIMPEKCIIMNYEELNKLKNIGVKLLHHSHSHKSLSSMSKNEIENDIDLCIKNLLKYTSTHPKIFVVPFGSSSDWSYTLEEILFRKGFKEIWMVEEPFEGWVDNDNSNLIRRTRKNVDSEFYNNLFKKN
tara:strand:+ start:474 stop:1310 length:837 start_codon:yes stop_codon:yes gene_type:complete